MHTITNCFVSVYQGNSDELPEKLPRATAGYYSTALESRGLRANAPIAPNGDANGNNRALFYLS
jgi:hypothetical protein